MQKLARVMAVARERAAARQVSPRLQRVARVLGWIALAMTVLNLGVLIFLRSDPGRRAVARGLERVISDEIPGSMTIGSLERIGLHRAIVQDVRFRHPNGATVLYVEQAEIELDLSDMLSGTIGFESARVEGGTLVIAVQPDGRTGLEAAFSAKGKSTGRPARLELRSIHVAELSLLIRPGGDEKFQMQNVRGFVSILQNDQPGVRVPLNQISGTLTTPKMLGSTLEIVRAEGRVRGNVEHVLDLHLLGELDGGKIEAHLAYFNRDKTPPVELDLYPRSGLKVGLAVLGAELRGWTTKTLDVRVH